MAKLKGLFDEQVRLDKLSQKKDPLDKLNGFIDFEFFRSPLNKVIGLNTDMSKGGRPAYDVVLMFKILILQRYYNISDDAVEYAILDRLSFMRFLGLGLHDSVPDAKTIWLFRDKLTSKGLVEKLFSLLDKQLDKDGIIVNKGKIVDATIVEVPIQRNSRSENQQLKEGSIPKEWSQQKLRQKDTDAKWVSHNGKNHFGYKDHVKIDTKTKLIRKYIASTANVHDSAVLEDLLDKRHDANQSLHADSAYRSDKIEEICAKKGMRSLIHEKAYRDAPLSEKQTVNNRKKSKVRARVEHVFGFMTNSMNGIRLKYRNKKRNFAAIGLMNITYNLFRLVQLNVTLSK